MIQETPGRSVALTCLLLAAAAALWAALDSALLFIVPRYEHAFRDRNMRLPAPTQWVVTAGHWAQVNRLLGLLLLPVVILLSWLLRHRVRESLPGWLWFGALLGIPVLLQLGMWWALLLP
jgi:type II secretory pathway component PulF